MAPGVRFSCFAIREPPRPDLADCFNSLMSASVQGHVALTGLGERALCEA